MSAEGFVEIIENTLTLQAARLHHRQDTLHEAAAGLTPTAETALAPQHRATQQTLHEVVRRLHVLAAHEGPQRRLDRQHFFAKGRYFGIFAQDGSLVEHS